MKRRRRRRGEREERKEEEEEEEEWEEGEEEEEGLEIWKEKQISILKVKSRKYSRMREPEGLRVN